MAGAFAPDAGLLATLSGTPSGGGGHYEVLAPDTVVRLWNVDIDGGRSVRKLPGIEPVLSPDGALVLTSDGDVANLRRTADGSPHPLDPLRYDSRVISAAFSPDGAILAVRTDEGIFLHALSSGANLPVKEIKAPSSGSIAFTSDSHLIWANGGYGVADVWDVDTGASILPTAPGCSDTSEGLIDPAGRVLLRICGEQTNAWTRRDDRFEGPKPLPYSISWKTAISPTAPVVAIPVDQSIELWDAATGGRRQPIEIGGEAYRVAFAPNGAVVAAASNAADGGYALTIIDVDKNVVRKSWSVPSVERLEFDATSQLLVVDHDQAALNVWQVDDGVLRNTASIDVHTEWTLDTTRKTIISWSERSTRLRSVDSGEELFSTSFDHPPRSGSFPGEVQSAAITSDGAYLVTATGHETRLWPLTGKSLLQTLRATVGGCLSPAFRETVLGESAEEAREADKRCSEQFGSAPDAGEPSSSN